MPADLPIPVVQAKSLNSIECTILTLGPWNSGVWPVTPDASVSSGRLKTDLFRCLTGLPVNNQTWFNHKCNLHYLVMCLFLWRGGCEKPALHLVDLVASILHDYFIKGLHTRWADLDVPESIKYQISVEGFSWHHVWQIQTNTWNTLQWEGYVRYHSFQVKVQYCVG